MYDEPTPPRPAEHKRSLFRRLSGFFCARNDASIKEAIEEAIDEVLEDREEGLETLAPDEKTMLRNVLSFRDLTVGDIMTTRTDVMAVPVTISKDALKQHIIEQRHTRIPVFGASLDHVEGFLHIKDLFAILAGDQPYDILRVIRPMLFVPPSMRITDLLKKMRRSGSHMAIVVDEYGGTDGLVTLEDLFEQIVGEIQDEHDEEEGARDLIKIGENAYEADARVHIEKLEEVLGFQLLTEHEEDEFETLGGLIFFELGRVPAKGEIIPHSSGVRFEILEADPRRIRRVRVMPGL